MEKVSIKTSNNFCPQALFLYGTYKEDGTPNFGTFCWFSYCWDSEMKVMACIGGEKLTKDHIHAGKVFSANLATEALIPYAEYFGNTTGYTKGKMDIPIEIEHGAVLPVPILKASPWVFELEVEQSVPLNGGEIFICKIRNVLAAKELTDEEKSAEERMELVAPVIWTSSGNGQYFSLNPIKKETFEKNKT
ncbi:MAG: flavin reductase [Firmicutes bacterium HGW-Firmicutes-21]|nr:MAG: flavin reductase [Firmicutes bacterium HGW-Firmicutes-21]